MSQPPSSTESKTLHPRFALNEAIHHPVRLSIFGALAQAEKVDFAFLREHLELKDSNLSQHLSALENLGYLVIEKGFVRKRARTWIALSPAGRAAFAEYLQVIQQIIAQPLDGPTADESERH